MGRYAARSRLRSTKSCRNERMRFKLRVIDPPLLIASTNLSLHDVAAQGVLRYARDELTG